MFMPNNIYCFYAVNYTIGLYRKIRLFAVKFVLRLVIEHLLVATNSVNKIMVCKLVILADIL